MPMVPLADPPTDDEELIDSVAEMFADPGFWQEVLDEIRRDQDHRRETTADARR